MVSTARAGSDMCLPLCRGLLGLTGHLKKFPVLWTLFCVLKARSTPPTDDERAMAKGLKPIAESDTSAHMQTLDATRATLEKAWAKQAESQAVRCTFYYTYRCCALM